MPRRDIHVALTLARASFAKRKNTVARGLSAGGNPICNGTLSNISPRGTDQAAAFRPMPRPLRSAPHRGRSSGSLVNDGDVTIARDAVSAAQDSIIAANIFHFSRQCESYADLPPPHRESDPYRASRHTRGSGDREVDFVLKNAEGKIVGVEVKAAA